MNAKLNIGIKVLAAALVTVFFSTGCAQKIGNVTASEATNNGPLVTVSGGELQGAMTDGIQVFKGIPYAAPPVGENRWREPQSFTWDGVRDAKTFGHDCMQKPFPSDAAPLGEIPAEDCLYLNVWAPESQEEPAPVVIWIHGGGYVNGGASPAVYDGAEFAKSGVVFVSFNYRLGRFGFFAHPALSAADEGQIGNYAFMDQIAAVKWVKNNIAAFNGDPHRITIMGESAGGGSVHTLMQAPASKDLIQGAIIMSGGGRSLMGERSLTEGTEQHPSAEQIGLNFAEEHGIEGTGPETLAQMRALSANDVLDGLNLTALFMPSKGKQTYVGGPLADGKIVLGSTQAMVESGQVAKVPVLVGTTSQDIGFGMAPDKETLFGAFGPYAEEARLAYDPNDSLPLQILNFMVGQDRGMQEPAQYFAGKMTGLGQEAYVYRFSYVAESIRDGQGAQHASEIPFFFKTIDKKYDSLTEKDKTAAELPFSYVVNFIKTGNPNGTGLRQWKAFDPSQNNILDITMDAEAVHGTDPWKDRMEVTSKYAGLMANR
ncbi:carboxylesterase family protein [Microbulbifer bruguierae]|uniref:Carboxylesterase family protein n=1 Tax=Microbulbifer bruguierae TaxID=3029061 RepID=A0ABY8NC60_9GAMM|nr:carboxylesterase family protein [Microbulbifer bruguierae]WGL16285.1 carboxylesterase family protein [Microbulbifer bruguierae]